MNRLRSGPAPAAANNVNLTLMTALHIGHFTDSFPPVINGVSTLVTELHAELLAHGEDSHVFTTGPAHNVTLDAPHVWRSNGIRLGTSPFYTNPWLNGKSRRMAHTLDVLHAHDSLMIGTVAARLAHTPRRPLVFTHHTRHDIYVLNFPRWSVPLLRAYAFGTVRTLMRASTVTTAPSSDAARWLKNLAPKYADRVRVLHNGARLERFENVSDRLARDDFGIGRDQTIFITVSRLAPEKNLSAFAEALIKAVHDGAQAHWLVIGDGPSRSKLEAQVAPIHDRVRFFGAIPNARVGSYLTMADVCAITSRSETNCISAIEGMACSLPYLGVQADWWEDFTVDQDLPAGLLAQPSTEDLAWAIRRLCDDPVWRAQMGAQAKRLSRKFDIRTITEQWIALYHELAQSQG
jgi:1,2-diacylglycerol 3-alpha-glucosyltransferase